MQTPFNRLGREALALDVPPQRSDAFSGNVYVGFGLRRSAFVFGLQVSGAVIAHLDRVEDLNYTWMAQGAELLESIFGERQSRSVCVDVEREDAAG